MYKRQPEHGEVYRDAEYKRLGTLSLLAGIDLLTGEAIDVYKRQTQGGLYGTL